MTKGCDKCKEGVVTWKQVRNTFAVIAGFGVFIGIIICGYNLENTFSGGMAAILLALLGSTITTAFVGDF